MEEKVSIEINRQSMCRMDSMADLSLLGAKYTLRLFCHEEAQMLKIFWNVPNSQKRKINITLFICLSGKKPNVCCNNYLDNRFSWNEHFVVS